VSLRPFPSLTNSAAASAAQPDLREGRGLFWSQICGLGTNVAVPGLDPCGPPPSSHCRARTPCAISVASDGAASVADGVRAWPVSRKAS
jgi:hypothetical protein